MYVVDTLYTFYLVLLFLRKGHWTRFVFIKWRNVSFVPFADDTQHVLKTDSTLEITKPFFARGVHCACECLHYALLWAKIGIELWHYCRRYLFEKIQFNFFLCTLAGQMSSASGSITRRVILHTALFIISYAILFIGIVFFFSYRWSRHS